MIRPTTFVCALLAFGSGLYLYQSKHRAQVLDREIANVVKDTQAAHERITMLTAEWQNLNELERLKGFAQQYLPIHTVLPSQTVPLAELGQRLPAPLPASAFAPPAEDPAASPAAAIVASTGTANTGAASAPPAVTAMARPAPRPAPLAATVATVASAAPAASPRPVPATNPVVLASVPLPPPRPALDSVPPRPVPRPAAMAAQPALLISPAVATPLGAAVPFVTRQPLVQRVAAATPVALPLESPVAVASAPPMVASALGVAAHGALLPPPVPMH